MKNPAMSPLDAIWLMMESADTPMHVGVLAIFRLPRNAADDYLSGLVRQMREARDLVAPWNRRLSSSVSGVAGYRLVEDRKIELDYHLRHSALPAPGGERELGVIVSRLHSNALDRSRPLWEFHLIEGLERKRFAFYLKVHHALIDDINAIPLLMSSLADSARRRNMPPPWSRPLSADGAAEASAWRQLLSDPLESLGSLGKAAGGLLRGALKPRQAGSFVLPMGTPRSTLNRQINYQRRVATQQLQRTRIESLARATHSSLNEILTYLCGSSLRRFFKEYNALPDDPLIGVMPVSLQERSERIPGSAIAGLRVALGTHIGDPLERLEAVKESIQTVREDRATLPEGAATSYVLLRAAPIFASQLPGLGRLVPPLFNLGVSHTIATDKPQYFNGARLEAAYPLSPLMQFSALSIDCVSYAGTLNIAFTGARDTLPHLQRMAVYFGKAVSDLEELLETVGDAR